MHSLTEENYLKAIYRLRQKSDEKISLTAIAEALTVNAASVIDMIRKLTDKKLISYDKKKGVAFTAAGQRDAVLIVRRHRLWEVFLLEKLGYTWDEVHSIAEDLEHISDPRIADKLDAFLGFPEYDPHGDPIPKADGKLPRSFSTSLADLKEGQQGQVVAVRDTSSAFLQYLDKLSIGIGTPINLVERISYDQSLVICIAGNVAVTVSLKFGENILVRT